MPPPYSNNLITIPLLFFIFIFSRFSGTAQSCTCSGGGLNLTGNSILLSDLVSGSQLPPSGSNIGCISVPANANLKIDINYIFSGTTFNMAANSRITVETGVRLTLQNICHLKNCDGDPAGWGGIIVQGGGEIDMSDCILENGALQARHLSKIRLVDNNFREATYGLIVQGYVSFIHFEDPDDFSGNNFYSHIYAIYLDHANFFYIGDKNAGSATVVNTIESYTSDLGIGVRMVGCRNVGVYGLNITGVFPTSTADMDKMVSIVDCANVAVKHCSTTVFLGVTAYGIYCSSSFGVLDFSNNSITSASAGIYLERFSGDYNGLKKCTMKDNYLNSTRGIVIEDYTADEGTYYQIEENEIDFFPKRSYWFYPGGILLNRVNGRYDIYNNTVTRLSAGNDPTYPYGAELRCIGIDYCTGPGKVDDNTLGYDMPLANTGIGVSTSRNIKFTLNTLSGRVQDENRPGSHGIMVTNCAGLGFCCNTVESTDFGTQFSSANNDIKFYTTTYGEHDTALYFPPAAALNKQINTGNDWGDATTTLDAYYTGSLVQAQINAPFWTSTSNINANKISPSGWFFLTGSDPYCGQLNFTCVDAISQDSSSITDQDSSALTNVGAENEYVLRFEQQRQLFRKLKENPDLIEWNGAVTDFYDQAETGIVGAFDSLGQRFRRLGALSTGLNDQYTDYMEYLDSLTALVEDIQEAYPGATSNEKADLREDMADLGEEITGVLYGLDTLHDQAAAEFQEGLARLLAANDSLQTVETWETNEKEINVLLFKHLGRLIDTFTNAEKQQIIEMAEACPQYEGAGVYKARLLRGTFIDSTFAGYDESPCMPAGFKVSKVKLPAVAGGLSVSPNPATDRVFIHLGHTAALDDRIVLQDLTGRILLSTTVALVSEISLPLTGIPSGLYLLSRQSAESAPVSVKLVISR